MLVESQACNVLDRVRDEQPCLVILDNCLGDGDMSGIALSKAVKAAQPDLPVVVISSGLTVKLACIMERRSKADLVLPKQGQRTFEEVLAFVEAGIEPDPFDECDGTVDDAKREFARRLVARSGGNKAEAARRAGVSWATLHRWLGDRDEGCEPPRIAHAS